MGTVGTKIADTLRRVTGDLPGGGEDRPQQRDMAEAVGRAIAGHSVVLVEAGTGTGKSLAYLVPVALSEQKAVVVTATKALQDQLAGKDLPQLARVLDRPLEWAVLKGRSNYACVQRAKELLSGDSQLELGGMSNAASDEAKKLARWALDDSTVTGDRADLDVEPSPRAWSAVSVTADECPGGAKCPSGEACFAEAARRDAMAADVIVVNAHLYGMHLATGGGVLPEHDVVVFDEAHQLEDTVSATAGLSIGAGRFAALSRILGSIVADEALMESIESAGTRLAAALDPLRDRRLAADDVVEALAPAQAAVNKGLDSLRGVDTSVSADVAARHVRAVKAATSLGEHLAAAATIGPSQVAWVEGRPGEASLEIAPLDVAPVLAETFTGHACVLTSATLPPGIAVSLGLSRATRLDVGSPFDYSTQSLLYCALGLPEPRDPRFAAASHDELAHLIEAAGGRTLALFTSWRAMEAAVAELRGRVHYPLLAQGDLPKARLVDQFATQEEACLFATVGFWQGIDVPGRTLSLVTIDKLPFPRPDDPLLSARRELAGPSAFSTIDLPRATVLLAQGVGRLIRTADDRGVVAVLDRRLSKARYAWDIVKALPPMRRTRDRAEAVAFLQTIRDGQ